MPLAVTLRLDVAAAERVHALRRAVLAAAPGAEAAAHPAHLTLLVRAEDGEDDARALADALPAAAEGDPVRLALAGLAVFPGGPDVLPVLWAAPVPTVEMLARHAALHTALPPGSPCLPHYVPGAWVPHVTVATVPADSAPAALAAALSAWTGPVEGWADRAEVVRFPPPVVLRDLPLLAPA